MIGMANDKPRSALIGFGACPLCGGKTHVKRRTDVDGKRPYSHCQDETDQGCNHTHYAKNATEERLMLAKMRPLPGAQPAPVATPAPPTATATPAPAMPAAAAAPSAPPKTAPPARRNSLFGLVGG